MDESMENLAIRAALGNNGGAWATHYTEAQKEHWRAFVRDLVAAEREACAAIADDTHVSGGMVSAADASNWTSRQIAARIRARKGA